MIRVNAAPARAHPARRAAPGRMPVSNRVVRLRRAPEASAPRTVVLLAPGPGRRDLLVVPPDTTEEAAEPLMSAAAELLMSAAAELLMSAAAGGRA